MSDFTETKREKVSLRHFKYTLFYILLIPFINWSFTWAPNVEVFPNWAFNPVTIVTGLVLVFRDFAQREVGHEVLIAMAIGLGLTYVTSGGYLALASGLAFLISELVDWAMFTFTKYRLSTRVLLSSALAAPIDTTTFLYFADKMPSQFQPAEYWTVPKLVYSLFGSATDPLPPVDFFTLPNVSMSIIGKMVGAVVIWYLLRQRKL